MKLEYVVTVPSELSAGLRGFQETVRIELENTDKSIYDDQQEGELWEHFRVAIAEWFDVAPRNVAPVDDMSVAVQGEQHDH